MRGVVRQCGILSHGRSTRPIDPSSSTTPTLSFPSSTTRPLSVDLRQKRGNESVDVGHTPRGRHCRMPQMWMGGSFCCTAIDTSILRTPWPSHLPLGPLDRASSKLSTSGGWVAGGRMCLRIGHIDTRMLQCADRITDGSDGGDGPDPSVCLRRGYSVGRVKNFKIRFSRGSHSEQIEDTLSRKPLARNFSKTPNM
jgi:hypothetical protein